jgi:type II secretory pathway pseudopilin PulG
MLLTIVVLAILASILVPQLTSDIPERLYSAAQIVQADLDLGRSLAVTNNSTYRVTFEIDDNRYFLQHTGPNNLLDVLPASAFRQNDDPPDRQTTELAELPIPAPHVRLAGVVRVNGMNQPIDAIDFQPLGGTQSQFETVVWLACGWGDKERFISVHVNPVTGLMEIGPLTTELPPNVGPP